MADERIRTIGRYVIEREIGRGGMAVVYKAFDPRLDRAVAIKLIQSGAFGSNIFGHIRERFEREAKALAKLRHPNIVRVHDYGEHEGAPYLVMDYLEGATLKEVKKPLRVETAVRLLRPIAEALNYVHEQGLLHRDVKPSNIMITGNQEVILTDFGIVKWLEDPDDRNTLTATGVGIGTPEYMAPEQGLGKAVDARSDAYSLTVIFYELITGEKPYRGDTPVEVLLHQASEPIPDPREIVPELNESVKRFLDRALAKKLEDRYPTMRDYLRDFDGLRLQALAGRGSKPTASTGTGEIRTELKSEPGTDSSIRFGRTDLQKVRAGVGTEASSGMAAGPAVVQPASTVSQPLQPPQPLQAAQQAAGQAVDQRAPKKKGWLIGALAAVAVIAGIVGLRMGLPRGTEVVSGTAEAALTIEARLGETQTALAGLRAASMETAGTSFRQETESGLNAALTQAAESIMEMERRTTASAEEARAAQQATSAEIERRATEVGQLATDVAKTEQANAEAAQRRESESAATMAMQVEIAMQQTAAAVTAQANAAAETAQAIAQAVAAETAQAIAQAAAAGTEQAVAQITATETAQAIAQAVAIETEQAVAQITATETAQAKARNPYADVKVGDIIEFGSYEQDNNPSNGPEPIQWQVLDVTDGNPLLISVYGLDTKPYNDLYRWVTWEGSAIRQWLNGEFFRTAFTSEEQVLIKKESLTTADNPTYGTSGGGMVKDRVTLLSLEEAGAYLPDAKYRRTEATAYAKAHGAAIRETGNGSWWLRTAGFDAARAAYMNEMGKVDEYGTVGTDRDKMVRPVIRLGSSSGDLSALRTGDHFTFGSYEQDHYEANGPEPIEWRVLEVSGGSALVVSEDALDARAYNNEWVSITWAECTLRGWLNGEFYDTAFNEEEKGLIALTKVQNADNPEYGTEGGADTEDRIFLLSLEEAERYFEDDEDRRAIPTEYAIARNVWFWKKTGTVWWWLRSPGGNGLYAAGVDTDGSLNYSGNYVDYYRHAVRPALRLKMTP